MTISLSVTNVREMLNEAARFSADLYILRDIEDAENQIDPKKKNELKEAIVRKSTVWAPKEFQPEQLETLFDLSRTAIFFRAMENVKDFQSKYDIKIKGLPWQ